MGSTAPQRLDAAVTRLQAETYALLGVPPSGAMSDSDPLAVVRAVHDVAVRALVTRGHAATPLLLLLGRAAEMEARLCRVSDAREAATRSAFANGVVRLRSCRSTVELFERLEDVVAAACLARHVAVSGDGREGPSDADARWFPGGDHAPTRSRRASVVVVSEGGVDSWVRAPVLIGGEIGAHLRVRPETGPADRAFVSIVERFAMLVGQTFEALQIRDRIAEVEAASMQLRSILERRGEDHLRSGAEHLGVEWPGHADSGGRRDGGASDAPEAEDAGSPALTPRQRQTFDLVLRGCSNEQIAERLVVSVSTVKSHVGAILRATGAVNRAEVITRFVGVGHAET